MVWLRAKACKWAPRIWILISIIYGAKQLTIDTVWCQEINYVSETKELRDSIHLIQDNILIFTILSWRKLMQHFGNPAMATNNEESLHRVASLSAARSHELVEFHFTAAPGIIT